jgi:hypothetical protein
MRIDVGKKGRKEREDDSLLKSKNWLTMTAVRMDATETYGESEILVNETNESGHIFTENQTEPHRTEIPVFWFSVSVLRFV